uniref:Uncharacterized protein n=1 Tax=Amphimedon queenslandica TaxID=400682 RepID=A0A1X7SJ39_AMPQE
MESFRKRHVVHIFRLVRRLLYEHYTKSTPVLQWFVTGRTVLIPKEGCEGTPDQFQLITNLKNAYKLYTEVVYNGKDVNNAYYAILVHGMISEQAKCHKNHFSIAWVDYQKPLTGCHSDG